MRTGIIKHLLIFFFIFSILEKTGVSVLALVVDNSKYIAECIAENETEESSNAPESKEAIKEYWLFQQALHLPEPYVLIQPLSYADEESNQHLAYFPAVPTPPPDLFV